MTNIFKFSLGQAVKDKLTGFCGVIVGRAEYITGCIKYALQAKKLDKDGKPVSWEWMDEDYLDLVGEDGFVLKPTVGGPQQLPPSKG